MLLVNGFGGTPPLELYLMVNAAHKVLAGAGVKVVRHLTGSYVTSLEMAGCSITVSAARRPMPGAVGCAGAHAGAALGHVTSTLVVCVTTSEAPRRADVRSPPLPFDVVNGQCAG